MTATATPPVSKVGEPAWEIAVLFPNQGELGEADYLLLTRRTRRLVEFTDGRLEVLAVPTYSHQKILLFVYGLLHAWAQPRGLGEVVVAALRVRVRDGMFREPDVAFMKRENLHRAQDEFWLGADLVVEVVSPDDPNRDLVVKRRDYAEAGIAEYWIVDPRFHRVTVLVLQDGRYVTASEATGTGSVTSTLLPGLTADAAAIFAAGKVG